jgi:hypothetical protein
MLAPWCSETTSRNNPYLKSRPEFCRKRVGREAAIIERWLASRWCAQSAHRFYRQANDVEFQNSRCEICLRAECRAGELFAEMKEKGESDNGKGDRKPRFEIFFIGAASATPGSAFSTKIANSGEKFR